MRDPRTASRYQRLRREYIARHDNGSPCALCHRPIDLTLPGTAKWGPTIEHRVPVRVLRQHAATWDDLVTLTCDTRTWALSHLHCQRQQGGPAAHATRTAPESRW